ncbi:MAG: VWA domain-containing protein [Rikenellaceae bacterium]
MFRFANSEYLYLLALIPALWILFILASRGRRKRLEKFGNLELVRQLMPDVSRGRVRLKFLLWLGALAFLILAAARPQFGSKLREEKSQGIEMMLVVDMSNSMLAEDFAPNRLESTKFAIGRLFEGLQQDRVGVIAFAGDAEVQLPITTDYRMAQAFTTRMTPSAMSVQGTDIGKAIDLALLSYSEQVSDSRVMILITDGEGHDSGAMAAAERAKAQGVKIYTIGIGTPEGAPIKIDGKFIEDENGDMVVSKLGEEMLQKIAATTEGAYIRATKQSLGLKEITDEINAMDKGELSTVKFEEYNEQYQYMLAVALLLLLLEFSILGHKNPALKRFNIFSVKG